MKTYIPNSKNYYVDQEGNVYSKHRKLRKNKSHTGYETVAIRYLDGSVKTQYVHRLVASVFLENKDKLPVVNHKDLNKKNNHINNLEWCSYLDNNLHMWENNANRDENGVAFWATYSLETIVKVCEMLQDGRRNIDIVRELGVPRSVVYMIRARKQWLHVSKNYEFRQKSRERKVSTKTIEFVCHKLTEGLSCSEISKLIDNKLSRQEVYNIKSGVLYKDVVDRLFK